VGCKIYYPLPLDAQECFKSFVDPKNLTPNAALASKEVLSLPIDPELTTNQILYVTKTLKTACEFQKNRRLNKKRPGRCNSILSIIQIRCFWRKGNQILELDLRPFVPLVSLLSRTQDTLCDKCRGRFITAFIAALIITRPITNNLSKHQIRQVFLTRQQVRDLAILHQQKIGIPTMGGIAIELASIIAVIFWASFKDLVIVSLLMYLLCSLLGAGDDILKIAKGNSRGVTSSQKLWAQVLYYPIPFLCSLQKSSDS
jgi:hypothetical protein